MKKPVETQYTAAAMVLLLSAAAAFAGFDASDYRYFKKLEGMPEATGLSGLAAVEFDEDIYMAAENDFSNMRLVTAGGKEVPFMVQNRNETGSGATERSGSAEVLAFERSADGPMRLTVERKGGGGSPAAVEIMTACRNFESRVSVFGSNDRNGWEPVARDAVIFDYSRYVNLRSTRVNIAGPAFRYYRIDIDKQAKEEQSALLWLTREHGATGDTQRIIREFSVMREDFRIDAVKTIDIFPVSVRRQETRRQYTVRDVSIREIADRHVTEIEFEASAVPARFIKLVAADRNFSRRATVEGFPGKDGSERQKLAAADVYRVNIGGRAEECVEAAVPEGTRCRKYRITIENHDSPPLDIKGVELRGESHGLIFFAEGGSVYSLFYGGRGAVRPVYDIDKVLSGRDTGEAIVMRAGIQEANISYREEIPETREGGGRMFLVAAVIGMVAVLVWLILFSLKRLDSAGTDGAGSGRA